MSDARAPSPQLQWSWLTFGELSLEALYELLALRQEVFVVGQRCVYVDSDGVDQGAYHLCGRDEGGHLVAYLRAYQTEGDRGREGWHIGRVLVSEARRGEGVGQALMREGVRRLALTGARGVGLSAQAYLERFYCELGFEVCGEGFDEVGIPHLPMRLAEPPLTHALRDISHVIFDLDGTLIDSSYDYATCFEQLALEWGCPAPSSERIRGLMYAGLLPQLAEALGPLEGEELERAVERFRELCIDLPLTHTQLYPGALALLDQLAERGVKLSVCTNRPQDLAELVLKELGIAERFELIVGGDAGHERKPSPEMLLFLMERLGVRPEQGVMVGDSEVDVQAARAAGLACAAVSWGYTKVEALTQARPTLLLNHPHELLTALSAER